MPEHNTACEAFNSPSDLISGHDKSIGLCNTKAQTISIVIKIKSSWPSIIFISYYEPDTWYFH